MVALVPAPQWFAAGVVEHPAVTAVGTAHCGNSAPEVPVVLDGDRPTIEDDPLFRIASHVVFSWECLRETTGAADLGEGLLRIADKTEAFLAVSNGPDDIVYLNRGKLHRLPAFNITAVDTLGGCADIFDAGSNKHDRLG